MAARTIVEASDVWDYFMEHKSELANSLTMIAENHEYGIGIFLTEDDDLPLIMVTADDEEIEEEAIVSRRDCESTVGEIYDKYLSKDVVNILIDESVDYTEAEELETIDEREMELDDAIYGCLMAIAPNLFDIADDPDELCEDLKDHICEYLYTQHGISVYRPMYLETEDGTDEFTEFPYPEMELEEE